VRRSKPPFRNAGFSTSFSTLLSPLMILLFLPHLLSVLGVRLGCCIQPPALSLKIVLSAIGFCLIRVLVYYFSKISSSFTYRIFLISLFFQGAPYFIVFPKDNDVFVRVDSCMPSFSVCLVPVWYAFNFHSCL